MSKNVHFILQGKGGVGKSTAAIFLMQYLNSKNVKVKGFDTDPVNQTFSAFKALDIQHLDVISEGTVNQRSFDILIEQILSSDSDFIIDNGASSFIPLANYIQENEIFELLAEHGVNVYLHTPVVGGAAMRDSLQGMVSLSKMTTRKNLVIWENQYFGQVEHKGIGLQDMKSFIDSSDSILGVVVLRSRTQSTFGEDIKKILSVNKTFDEALSDKNFFIIEQSRIKTMRRDIYNCIDSVGGSLWLTNH